MSDSHHQDINAALSLHLKALNRPTHFENEPGFTPPDDEYLQESYLPGDVDPVGMEDGSTNDYIGIYQVDVMARRDRYKRDGYALADVVASHFKRGTPLSHGQANVRIERVRLEAPMPDKDRWKLVLSIRWRALIK